MVLTLSYLILSLLPVFKLFPVALQTVTKKIVHSRANSTLVGVFTILLLFIASFANMVGTCTLHFCTVSRLQLLTRHFKMSYTINHGRVYGVYPLRFLCLSINLSCTPSQMLLIAFKDIWFCKFCTILTFLKLDQFAKVGAIIRGCAAANHNPSPWQMEL